MKRAIMMVMACLATALGAQDSTHAASAVPARSPVVCEQNPAQAAYTTCALWLDRDRVRRGAKGELVARSGFFNPIDLEALVAGDSAKRYARTYETESWIAESGRAVGMVVTLAGMFVVMRPGCEPPTCSRDARWRTGRVLGFTGLGITAISLPFHTMARTAGTKAVWWHNALLGR